MYSGRYIAENDGGNGFIKLILDQDKRILGASMIGNPGSEMICAMAMAVTRKLTCAEFAKVVFPHPTVSEIFREAVITQI